MGFCATLSLMTQQRPEAPGTTTKPSKNKHDHDHGHSHENSSARALLIAFTMTATIMIFQIIGGLIAGSLSLISDAMHMLSDSTGLLIAVVAMFIGRRAASAKATYGNRRVEVLAALINSLVVMGVSVLIVVRAFARFGSDHEIETGVMMGVALVGLLANMVSAAVLFRRRHDSLNLRGAYLHVLSDMLGSVAVIIAAGIIFLTGWTAADAIASLVIAALVLPRAYGLAKNSLTALLEHTPVDHDFHEVSKSLQDIPHVTSVHDLHIWTLDGSKALATCHLVVEDQEDNPLSFSASSDEILTAAQAKLRELGISHSTIQIEATGHLDAEETCHNEH